MKRETDTNFYKRLAVGFLALLVLLIIGTLIINTAYAEETITWALWTSSSDDHDYWLRVEVRDMDSNILQADEYKLPGSTYYPDIITVANGTTHTFQMSLIVADDVTDLWVQLGWMIPDGTMGINANSWDGKVTLGIIIMTDEPYTSETKQTAKWVL